MPTETLRKSLRMAARRALEFIGMLKVSQRCFSFVCVGVFSTAFPGHILQKRLTGHIGDCFWLTLACCYMIVICRATAVQHIHDITKEFHPRASVTINHPDRIGTNPQVAKVIKLPAELTEADIENSMVGPEEGLKGIKMKTRILSSCLSLPTQQSVLMTSSYMTSNSTLEEGHQLARN